MIVSYLCDSCIDGIRDWTRDCLKTWCFTTYYNCCETYKLANYLANIKNPDWGMFVVCSVFNTVVGTEAGKLWRRVWEKLAACTLLQHSLDEVEETSPPPTTCSNFPRKTWQLKTTATSAERLHLGTTSADVIFVNSCWWAHAFRY